MVWGWTAYFWSALDAAPGGAWWNNPQDRLAHGNVPFLEWYLQQMRAYEQQHGSASSTTSTFTTIRRPAACRCRRGRERRHAGAPPALDARRSGIRATSTRAGSTSRCASSRACANGSPPDYPGTKLAITEYNWGALDHVNGALAQADVLGIFGREGLDLATLWDPPTASEPGAYAFRMYRNYDGAGGRFGDVAVQAASADRGSVRRSSPPSAPATARSR